MLGDPSHDSHSELGTPDSSKSEFKPVKNIEGSVMQMVIFWLAVLFGGTWVILTFLGIFFS